MSLEPALGATRAFPNLDEFLVEYEGKEDDCVVLDLSIPAGAAVEFVGQLRRSGFTTPVVMLSDEDETVEASEALRYGGVHILEKPINEQKLIDLVEAAIKSTRTLGLWPPVVP